MARTFYADRLGHVVYSTTDFSDYLKWIEDHDKVTVYDYYTSDMEPICPDPSCDCKHNSGFTKREKEILREEVGVEV